MSNRTEYAEAGTVDASVNTEGDIEISTEGLTLVLGGSRADLSALAGRILDALSSECDDCTTGSRYLCDRCEGDDLLASIATLVRQQHDQPAPAFEYRDDCETCVYDKESHALHGDGVSDD